MRALAILAVLLAACTAPQDRREVAEGERLATERCGSCHAVGPTGASPRPNAPAFRALHRRYPVDDLAEALAEGIVTGHPDMPEQSFSQPEIIALLAYLRSLER
jgi:mono/diheme cytochrome c family protein